MPVEKTAAAYVRVSTEDQLEYSPDSQIKKIREYAERNNIAIWDENIFIDEGISGRNAMKRPAFMKMIALAKTKPKPFDMILVWKFSRFARNREDSIVYKSMLRKQCEIEVVSVSEQIGEDKTSILIEALLEAMDEYYSINLAEEVKRGMNEKFSRGEVVSQPPFGYKMGDGIFVPHESNAPVVRMIFENFLSGMSIRRIAVLLNEMGVRTTKGNRFENRTVEYILCNPAYIGKLRRNPKGRDAHDRFHLSGDTIIIDGHHEPIVTEEMFRNTAHKLSENKKRFPANSRRDITDIMLRGLVRCSSCGSTLVQAVKGKSLQCCKYAKGQCEISHSITVAKINEAVIEKLSADLEGCKFLFTVKSDLPHDDEKLSGRLIEKERKKLERVKEAFEAGIDSLEEYKQNKTRIMNRIAELESTLPAAEEKIRNTSIKTDINVLTGLLRDCSVSENEKNEMLRSVISSIEFDKRNMTFRIRYHPVF